MSPLSLAAFRRVPYLVLIPLIFSACSRGSGAPSAPGKAPASSASESGKEYSTARSSKPGFVDGMPQTGMAADGSYRLRLLHIPSVKLIHTVSTLTPNGCFTQMEYMTRYGVLAVVQQPRRIAPPPPSPSAHGPSKNQSGAQQNDFEVADSGITKHGFAWHIVHDVKGAQGAYLAHIEFSDSWMDMEVPDSVPIQSLKSSIEEVY